jgi:hypothetical protein
MHERHALLLRERDKLAKETLHKHHLYNERRLRPPEVPDIEWRCYVRAGIDSEASWFKRLSQILALGDAEPVRTTNAGAVLLWLGYPECRELFSGGRKSPLCVCCAR